MDITYQPNESLYDRHQYQVRFSDEELESFEADCDGYELSNGALSQLTPHTASSQPPPHTTSIIAMLQEQQDLLNKVLHEQQDIHLQLEENDKRVKALEDKI